MESKKGKKDLRRIYPLAFASNERQACQREWWHSTHPHTGQRKQLTGGFLLRSIHLRRSFADYSLLGPSHRIERMLDSVMEMVRTQPIPSHPIPSHPEAMNWSVPRKAYLLTYLHTRKRKGRGEGEAASGSRLKGGAAPLLGLFGVAPPIQWGPD